MSKKTKPLTPEEERKLARRWRKLNDAKALARLIEAHLGLVINIARGFKNSGACTEDLIQEGNLGLVFAARKFDPNRGVRLGTYATYWIRACILEHIVRTHGAIRIGTTRSQRKIFFGLGKARRKIATEQKRDATPEELAAELGVKLSELNDMLPRIQHSDLSLDGYKYGDQDEGKWVRSLADCLPNKTAANPEDMVIAASEEKRQRELLAQGLKTLDQRERLIIKRRHLAKSKPTTLAVLGRQLGVSRERVRQIESEAKTKLRRVARRGPW